MTAPTYTWLDDSRRPALVRVKGLLPIPPYGSALRLSDKGLEYGAVLVSKRTGEAIQIRDRLRDGRYKVERTAGTLPPTWLFRGHCFIVAGKAKGE